MVCRVQCCSFFCICTVRGHGGARARCTMLQSAPRLGCTEVRNSESRMHAD